MNHTTSAKRIFLALPIAAEAANALVSAAQHLHLKDMHWIPVANYHITLTYLGEVTQTAISLLKTRLHALETMKSFTLNAQRLCRFPNSGGHILAALPEPSIPLDQLHQAITALLTDCELLPVDNRFKPHISIARYRKAAMAQGDLHVRLAREIPVEISALRLYQGLTINSQTCYQSLTEIQLDR